MSDKSQQLLDSLNARFADTLLSSSSAHNEVTIEVESTRYLEVCRALKDEPIFCTGFHQIQLDIDGVTWPTRGDIRLERYSTPGRIKAVDVLDFDFKEPNCVEAVRAELTRMGLEKTK